MRKESQTHSKRLTAVVGCVAVTVLAAGCSSGNGTSAAAPTSAVPVKVDAKAAALLPGSTKSITVGVDPTIGQPWVFQEDGGSAPTGVNVELANVIGGALGVTVTFRNTSFAGLIPGLQAKRYDMSSAPMLDTTEREKTVDLVNYLHGGSAFLVSSSDTKHTDLSLTKLCGLTAGAIQGSAEALALQTQSAACTKAGKSAVDVKQYQEGANGVLAVTSRRIVVFDAPVAQVNYMAKNNPQLKRSGQAYNAGLSSLALAKGSTLTKAVEAGLDSVIQSGAYHRILAKYGLTSLAVKQATLNAGSG
ncbi:transporter substrate-binding domain-containing protein [Streptomyces sp. NPDC058469]|uniref:transporter substrate-binding domain-containing protein n=1 Tax=Streptomyces sp. NPDC058469 TaxID=3346514 RepID=UPI00365D412A